MSWQTRFLNSSRDTLLTAVGIGMCVGVVEGVVPVVGVDWGARGVLGIGVGWTCGRRGVAGLILRVRAARSARSWDTSIS